MFLKHLDPGLMTYAGSFILTGVPGSPLSPGKPLSPGGPSFPGRPVGPGSPLVPSFPEGPGSPCSPGGPRGPGWPRSPMGPVSPDGPWKMDMERVERRRKQWWKEECKAAGCEYGEVIYCSSNSMCTTMNELTWGPTTPGGPGGPILPWKPCKTQTQLTVYLENTDVQIWKAKTCPLTTIITVCDWDEEKSAVMTFFVYLTQNTNNSSP